MVGGNDRPLFAINKDQEPSKTNNHIHGEQWPTNVVGIAWTTVHATVRPDDFYSYSRCM